MAQVRGAFLYNLSNFNGPIPFNWSRVFIDRERTEIYVLYQNFVRVFNENGMEIYRFGDDSNLGHVVDIAVDRDGTILMLTYTGSESLIVPCNYRGEPVSKIQIKNLPPEFTGFSPKRLIHREGRFYLADTNSDRIAITDTNGSFQQGYDIISILGLQEKDRADKQMVGFSVDKEGNMLFTIPVLFKAYRLSPDGKIADFGRPGGAPGKFGVVAGIISDNRGNYLVVDKLKCTVMVFDKNYNFLTQFGDRGLGPGNLIAPDDLTIDGSDRVYVTQSKKRGVNVYKITYD